MTVLGVSAVRSQTQIPSVWPQTGIVKSNANLRAGWGTNFPIIGAAQAGQTLTIIGCNVGCTWYALPNGEWIAAFLVEVAQLPQTLPLTSPLASPLTSPLAGASPFVIAAGLAATSPFPLCPQAPEAVSLRIGPGTEYRVVGSLDAHECIVALGRDETGEWIKISTGPWVPASALAFLERTVPEYPVMPPPTPAPTPTPVSPLPPPS